MGVLNNFFNVFLSRDQRERHTRSKWEKSVAQAARDLGLDGQRQPYPSPPPTPACTTSSTLRLVTSCPMTPSLSSASSSSGPSSGANSGANSGVNSPVMSRPGTSCSTSPRPDIVRRHTSIARNPISYDCLISVQRPEKPRRSSSDSAPRTHQLLYPLPPLEPMEGVGKYRRSVNVTEDFLHTQQRNMISALQPLPDHGDDRVSRFQRRENKDTTTPPRAYSSSPNEKDVARRQLAWQTDLARWASEKEAAAAETEDNFEDIPNSDEAARASRPLRVAPRRRTLNPRERSKGVIVRTGAAAPARKTSGRPAHQQVGALSRNLKKGGYKPKAAPQKAAMSASMETLVSGEE